MKPAVYPANKNEGEARGEEGRGRKRKERKERKERRKRKKKGSCSSYQDWLQKEASSQAGSRS